MARSILVVAAHPDDELLGCGGAVARHVLAGDRVQALILGEGAAARPGSRGDGPAQLKAAAQRAAAVIGAEPPQFAGLADNRLDSYPLLDIVQRIEAVIDEITPTVVYTHHGGDLNLDHQIVHRAVLTACRPLPQSSVRAIYAFETPSSTEWSSGAADPAGFRPSRFVGVADVLTRKLEALTCYADEMRPFPHARSLEAVRALAAWRGASAGLTAAEAFMVIREIVD